MRASVRFFQRLALGAAGLLAACSSSAAGGAGAAADAESGVFVPAPVRPSQGCGKVPTQTLATYVRQQVTGMNRVYDLLIPNGYDPKRAYRTIFVGHDCDGSIPFTMGASTLQNVSNDNAILVALRALSSQQTGQLYGSGCFDTGASSASQTEMYFDEVLKEVSSSLCVDTARVFIVGVGSGSWLTNLLGCVRAGVIRGQGNAAGGLPAVPAACAGPIAAMLAHDMQDTTDPFAGGELARDRIVKMNGCGASTVPYVYDGVSATKPCVTYEGCRPDDPVVWCPTTGEGHADEVPITTLGLWRFFSQF